MKPKDLIEGGLLQSSDLDGAPPAEQGAELGPLGRYELLEELGRGGAAIVYRARDPLLNREVALKRLRFGDPELETRFLREAGLLARLSHPGIMPVFDFGREGESLYYTMPLAPGLTLDLWVAEHRADHRETARVMREAAEALAHAHEHGVLHRDVKPANILVSAEGKALVADFGLGRAEDPDSREAGRMTESGELMGTPSYMAPEIAAGGLKREDARCDVYSLGATLYEALTGMPPFIGESSLEILRRIEAEEPTAPRKLAPGVPPDLEVICLRALEKDPARRYATAREFADDLGRFLAGEPILAHRASPFYRIRRRLARRKALVAVAVAGVLASAGIVTYGLVRERAAVARRERASFHLDWARRHEARIDELLVDKAETDPEIVAQSRLALDRIRQAIEHDPSNPEAFYLKGRVHLLTFNEPQARENFDLAVSLSPFAPALLERAILDAKKLVELRQLDAGADARRRGDELRGRIHADLQSVRKLTTVRQDLDFAEALLDISTWDPGACRRAAEILEGHAALTAGWRAYYWKGIAELLSAQFDKARASLEKALDGRRRSRVSAHLLERLGVVLYLLDRPEDSIVRFREAITRDPELPEPRYHLANALLSRREEKDQLEEDIDEAIREVDAGLKLTRGSLPAEAHAIRGEAYAMKHRKNPASGLPVLKAAKESLDAALRSFAEDPERATELRRELRYVDAQLARPRDY